MRKWAGLIAAILAAVGSAAPAAAQAEAPPGIEVSGLAHKIVSGPDMDGDYLVSIKVTVKNATAKAQDVEVWAQGIDENDFEVFDVVLEGTVEAGITRVLTDTQYIPVKVYKSIVQWRIED